MRTWAKATARQLLARRGFHVSHSARPDAVMQAIRYFAPRDSGHPLIRLGGAGDGGYLVPDDLDGIAACFSPGVSTVASFEEDLATRYGIPSFLADYSVDGPPVANPLLSFTKRFLGPRNDEIHIRLEDWVAGSLGPEEDGDLILQMDIEGAEYPVLIDTPTDLLRRFRIIVLELHGLHGLFDRVALPLLEGIFAKLTMHHSVVHLHPNNSAGVVALQGIEVPPLLEVTLLRNDRLSGGSQRRDFPHPLDSPCVAGRPDVVMPRAWLG